MATSPSRLLGLTSRLAVFAGSAFGLAAVQHADAAATFADFDNNIANIGTGTVGGVGFTISVTGTPEGSAGNGFNNISNKNYNGDPWDRPSYNSGVLESIDYTGHTVTIAFDQAVSDLTLYLWSFRAGGNNAGTYGGAHYYTFSQDFALGADFSGGTRSSSGTLSTPTGWWVDGRLSFSGQITTLSWTSYASDGTTLDNVEGQAFTFSATASAVPGAGLAGLATVGLAGVSRRRRR